MFESPHGDHLVWNLNLSMSTYKSLLLNISLTSYPGDRHFIILNSNSQR